MTDKPSHCGYIAIVGRPNVGKSTLLNQILGRKLSITCRKPQTTRHHILGLKTVDEIQAVYVDTPGLHKKEVKALNKAMNRTVHAVLRDVDVVVFVVNGLRWTDEDDLVLKKLKTMKVPVILAINQIDRIKNKQDLLPIIQTLSEKMDFYRVIPISAKTGKSVPALEKEITTLLPEGPHLFPDDQVTDRSQRFVAAEFVREKLTRVLGEELPYAISVEIEKFEDTEKILNISALIIVERSGQKAIVVGNKGAVLKEVGKKSRIDMENFFGKKVFLELWVKVRSGWSDSNKAIRELGYDPSDYF
ncbi:MAG: GTPase Era [Legionellales bacterium]|nr:GTPase Era [Legionellales bacterium]|tara:strand:- start:1276 stop:2184 length:909 start_codon:yes stop_codon:yes gene_type:complete